MTSEAARVLTACAAAALFGFVGSIPTTGPISVLMFSRAAAGRFDSARRIGLGASLAEGVYAGVAFWGFAALLSRVALIVPISRGVSAVVLTAIGAVFVRWRPGRGPERPEHAVGTLALGFTVSGLNPTLLVTWSTAVAFLFGRGLGGLPAVVAIPFGASAAGGVALWILTLVAILRRGHGVAPAGTLTVIVRAMGVLILGLGIWSGIELGRWLVRRSGAHAGAATAMQVRRREAFPADIRTRFLTHPTDAIG